MECIPKMLEPLVSPFSFFLERIGVNFECLPMDLLHAARDGPRLVLVYFLGI